MQMGCLFAVPARRPCYANGALKLAQDETGKAIPMKDVGATKEQIAEMQVVKPDAATAKLMAVPDRSARRWVRLPGHLTNVAVSSLGSIYGVNRYRQIWAKRRWNVGRWTRMGGSLRQISVNNAGTVVTGVNIHRHIWYTRVNVNALGATRWARAPGSLVDVSSGGRFMYGVNHFDHIYRAGLLGRNWCRLPGALIQISAHGTKVVGVNRGGHVWQYLGYGRWRRFVHAPLARWASMGRDGEMWVIARSQAIFRMVRGQRFHRLPGALVQVDVADRNNIVGVNRYQQIWAWVARGGRVICHYRWCRRRRCRIVGRRCGYRRRCRRVRRCRRYGYRHRCHYVNHCWNQRYCHGGRHHCWYQRYRCRFCRRVAAVAAKDEKIGQKTEGEEVLV